MKSTLFGEIKVFIQLDLVDMKRLQKEMFDLDYVFFSLSKTNCSDDFSEMNPTLTQVQNPKPNQRLAWNKVVNKWGRFQDQRWAN